MNIEQGLYKHLSGTTVLTALTSDRIYPLIAPQGASVPFITYQQISNPKIHAMQADPSIWQPRFQLNSFADTYAGAKAVAKQVETALKDYKTVVSGLFGDGTSGVDVQRIFAENEIDLTDIDPDTMSATFHISQDFIIWHTT